MNNNNKPLNQNKQSFEIPESLLNQLDECTKGGFILFAINDSGQPVIYQKYDCDINAIGLQTFVRHWAENMDEVNSQIIFNNIVGEGCHEEED